jgi:large subunit ribosomal protein L6
MSRIGSSPIELPKGVEVSISGQDVSVKGTRGELSMTLPGEISASVEEGIVQLGRPNDESEHKAMHGLARSLVQNMVTGVSDGFEKKLEIVGVGYRATAKGKDALELQLGFSHPVNIKAPAGIEFDVPQQTEIIIKGIDKQLVGQVAADIRKWRKPEPYKGKGIKYEGEHVIRKAGKAAK